MRAFTEAAAKSRRQAHTRFSEFVAQAVGGGQSIFPAPLARAIQQADLRRMVRERGCLHSQQPDWNSSLPVLSEQGSRLLEDFGVKLCWLGKGVSPGDRGEIFIPEFQLNRPRVVTG